MVDRARINSLYRMEDSGLDPIKARLDALELAINTSTGTGTFTTLNAPTGRCTTLTIAANDGSNLSKSQADYICDGVSDEIEINNAINALPTTGAIDIKGIDENLDKNQGGKILLLEGSFNLSAPIDFTGKNNITIEGQGSSTVVNNQSTTGSHAIQSINPSGVAKVRPAIKNLLVQGNPLSGDGIHIEEMSYEQIRGVFAQGNGRHGIYIETISVASGDNKTITDCQCQFNNQDGLHLDHTHETLVTGCHLEENYRYNLGGDDVTDLHVANCSIEDCHGSHDVFITNGRMIHFSNLIVEGAVSITMNNATSYHTLINNTEISGVFTYDGGTTAKLLLSNNKMTLGNLKASQLSIRGGNTIFIQSHTAEIYESLDIATTGYVTAGSAYTFEAVTNSVSFNVNGCAIGRGITGNLTFTNNGSYYNVRMSCNSNNFRMINIICSDFEYLTITDNNIIGTATFNVAGSMANLSLSNNIISWYLSMIINGTLSGGGIIESNIIKQNSSITNNISNAQMRNNEGFTTESSGHAYIGAGYGSVTVAHNLDVTPQHGDITVTPHSSWGATASFWVSTYTATTFKIYISPNSGVDIGFIWKAIVL